MYVCAYACMCVCRGVGGPGWTGDVLQSCGAYWITIPFSSFPFTNPPIFCCVPSRSNWPLHTNMIPEVLFVLVCNPPFPQTVVVTIFQHDWNSVRSL